MKLKPGLGAFYAIQPGNRRDLASLIKIRLQICVQIVIVMLQVLSP